MAGDRTKTGLAAAFLFAVASGPALAHDCDDDARVRARPLLALHFDAEESTPIEIADTVKQIPGIDALKGGGRLDVLEVWGYIYKGTYRMRFLYAQIPEVCLLIGEEIIEASDPY